MDPQTHRPTDPQTNSQRNPYSAAALTLVMPGLGQVYCGALLRGLAWMALATALVVWMVLGFSDAILGDPHLVVLVDLLLFALILAGSGYDAYRLARRTRPDYRPKEYNRWEIYLLLAVISTGGGLGYGILIRESWIHPMRVSADSMAPAFHIGDRVLVFKQSYEKRDPRRGDVVIFRNPGNRQELWLKRVVAVGGDKVEMRDGALYLNDEKLPLEPAGEEGPAVVAGSATPGVLYRERNYNRDYQIILSPSEEREAHDMAPVIVPPRHLFLLGDNRAESLDSRYFGPVSVEAVVGGVGWILWPASDWSRFGRFGE